MGEKEALYAERDNLVAFLSKVYPSHLAEDSKEPDWPIVCIHSDQGQMSWHIPRKELPLFDHLSFQENDWDGHSTEEMSCPLNIELITDHNFSR